MNTASANAADVLKHYRVPNLPIYIVGTFDNGVTVFNQQIRAMNLVWALIESDVFSKQTKVAIVGAGFSGLTVAAGLLAKRIDNVSITMFEQRDVLLPLQQGSDSRWLHPRIYDWPADGSEANVAMLPVLNWTAARASDVVVQILAAWKKLLTEISGEKRSLPLLYCNAGHLQIYSGQTDNQKKLKIEWIGEVRESADGTAGSAGTTAVGRSDEFDVVVLTTGFGLEKDSALSYWRNETIGQPDLGHPDRTFLVSGQGDGAMIDLLRLRISQYRQDRILDELFGDKPSLFKDISDLYLSYKDMSIPEGLFGAFEKLEGSNTEFLAVVERMKCRLRRDTKAVLHLKVRKMSELFDDTAAKISFQNKLLVFVLYKCGGFIPSSAEENTLLSQHGIASDCILRRHGTLRNDVFCSLLSNELWNVIEDCVKDVAKNPFAQSSSERWPGGYFGFPGKSADSGKLPDDQRVDWRREYLPGVTELIATAFCTSLAGMLLGNRTARSGRLRVTLHRALVVAPGGDLLLQQTCDYQGTKDARAARSGAARTFPARNATIGLAYTSQRIIRSKENVDEAKLQEAMAQLDLHAVARKMSSNVGFVIGIPLLVSESSETRAIGVIYIDSTEKGFFIDDGRLKTIVCMANQFMEGLDRAGLTADRIRNISQASELVGGALENRCIDGVKDVFPPVEIEPPTYGGRFRLNYDYSDFIPVKKDV